MRRREHKVSYLSSEAIFAIPAMKPSKVILSLLICSCLMLSDIYYESSSKIRGYAQDLFIPLGALVNIPIGFFASIPDSLRTRSDLMLSLEQVEEEKDEEVDESKEEVEETETQASVIPSTQTLRSYQDMIKEMSAEPVEEAKDEEVDESKEEVEEAKDEDQDDKE